MFSKIITHHLPLHASSPTMPKHKNSEFAIMEIAYVTKCKTGISESTYNTLLTAKMHYVFTTFKIDQAMLI